MSTNRNVESDNNKLSATILQNNDVVGNDDNHSDSLEISCHGTKIECLEIQQSNFEDISKPMRLNSWCNQEFSELDGSQSKFTPVDSKSTPKLSFEAVQGDPNDAFLETGNLSTLNGSSRLSVNVLSQHTPMESEAETYILRAVEASDPTVYESNEVNLNNLEAISPADLQRVFSVETTISAGGYPIKDKTLKKPKAIHRRDRSTAENLFDLTENLVRLQGKQGDSIAEHQIASFNSDGRSSAESLANNAIRLIRQRKSTKNIKQNTNEISPDTPATTPMTPAEARWAKVKTSVVTGALKQGNHTDIFVGQSSSSEHELMFEEVLDVKDDTTDTKGIETKAESGRLKVQQAPIRTVVTEMKEGFQDFENWLVFKKANILTYIKLMMFFILPALGVSAILFYIVNNPPCGTSVECVAKRNSTENIGGDIGDLLQSETSYSWWILFVCVRHGIIVTLSAMTQAIAVDFLCVRTRTLLRVAGPVVSLFTIQSKGWPFLMTFWGIYSFIFLYGNNAFANHWLFWQDSIVMFTNANPSGNVPSRLEYRKLLILGIVFGIVGAVKRFWVALIIGRSTFSRYASDLSILMAKVLLVGQVAELARDVESYGYRLDDFNLNHDVFTKSISQEEGLVTVENSTKSGNTSQIPSEDLYVGKERLFKLKEDPRDNTNTIIINRLLGEWEEPKEVHRGDEKIKISSIIQFRTSLSCMNTHVPFGPDFGLARTRQECIESTETVFRQLLQATPGKFVLTFDTLALLAVNDDGTLDEEVIRELIRIFRPDRNGNLTLIDFAKSVDAVYKELRLLRASVLNSSRMDRAFEAIINVVFYFILYFVALYVIGINPLVLFASISGFVLAFAFMIGAASSKYFEGILFILIRRPYDIGDRIHVSNPNNDTSSTGSMTWFVRDVDLFTTTVCLAATNEVATYSNGSLASSRIINAARSPNACLFFPIKFPISASYAKLQIFQKAVEDFIKARPREYLSLSGFRCSKVEADLGYVEYTLVVNHRESWQNLGALLSSKAELASFALELSKKMNLRYISPPMPIDLRMSASTMRAFKLNEDQVLLDTLNDKLDDESSMFDETEIDVVKAMFDKKA